MIIYIYTAPITPGRLLKGPVKDKKASVGITSLHVITSNTQVLKKTSNEPE